MPSGNPLLKDRTFELSEEDLAAGYGQPVPAAPDQVASPWPPARTADGRRTMTMGGVASATGVMFVFLLAAAFVGWQQVGVTTDTAGTTNVAFPMGWLIGAVFVGLGLAVACSFKPMMARFLAVPYAIAEGVVLGVIAHAYDTQSQGVALQAVIATAGVFIVMLALYGLRVLRATPKFTKGVIAATSGIFVMYAIGFIASLFGVDLRFWNNASPMGILISVVIVGVAAFNLILDFDFIERGSKEGLPAAMDWYGAFALTVTLVWLYLEMLRLLSKLQRN